MIVSANKPSRGRASSECPAFTYPGQNKPLIWLTLTGERNSYSLTESAHIGENREPGGLIPRPDPSVLTTAQLLREIAAVRELFEIELKGVSETSRAKFDGVMARFDAMDKAIRLLQDISDKFPGRIDEKITALREVHEQRFAAILETFSEKFSSIQVQFKERDVRGDQTSRDSKVAIDAALQATKESSVEQNKSFALATAKSEAATMKQIDQLGLLIQAGTKATDDKFEDVKERLTRIEGRGEGADKIVVTNQASSSYAVAIAAVIVAVLAAGAIIVIAVLKR